MIRRKKGKTVLVHLEGQSHSKKEAEVHVEDRPAKAKGKKGQSEPLRRSRAAAIAKEAKNSPWPWGGHQKKGRKKKTAMEGGALCGGSSMDRRRLKPARASEEQGLGGGATTTFTQRTNVGPEEKVFQKKVVSHRGVTFRGSQERYQPEPCFENVFAKIDIGGPRELESKDPLREPGERVGSFSGEVARWIL